MNFSKAILILNFGNILLSAFDIEKGRMQMEFLHAQVPYPKTEVDYKKTLFEFDIKDVKFK